MKDDIECPYCNADQEINHDDGYGYEEDRIFEQECSECEKAFTFTTFISFDYTAKKAPCLNGESHEYKETHTTPRRYTRNRCEYCGDEKPLSQARLDEITAAEDGKFDPVKRKTDAPLENLPPLT